MTPRPYLSYTQMSLFERSPEQWKRIYLEGEQVPINEGMAKGRDFANAMENGEMTGDVLIDMATMSVPRFSVVEYEISAELSGVPLLGKLDTYDPKTHDFKEYKTGKTKWSQEKVDKNDQITFYCSLIFAKFGRVIPKSIELVYLPTKRSERGEIELTGDILRFYTSRNLGDILKMSARQKKVWGEIKRLSEEYYLGV